MTKCITPYCHDSTIIRPTTTRTPGFFPDFECLSCGARWVDGPDNWNKRKSLRDLYDAVKDFRMMSGDTDGHSVGSRSGRREP